jgi:hypothetical protein
MAPPKPTDPRPAQKAAETPPPMQAIAAGGPLPGEEPEDEPIPAMQLLLDNPFVLLFIGVAMPTVLYIVWGVMEIVGIPVAK